MSDVNKQAQSNDGIHLDAVIGFLEGQKKERERIIKLLEPLTEHEDFCRDGCSLDGCPAHFYQHAVDLIKGEQK